jgi:hypothetical protein
MGIWRIMEWITRVITMETVLIMSGVTGFFKFVEKGMPLVSFLLKPMVQGNSSSIQQGVILIKTEFITRTNPVEI